MPPSRADCPRCGAQNDPSVAACAICGQGLTQDAPSVGARAEVPGSPTSGGDQGRPQRLSRRTVLFRVVPWTVAGVAGGIATSYFVYEKITDPVLVTYRKQWANTAVWSPDGTRVASTGAYGAHVWEALTGRTLIVCRPKDDPGGVAWSEDGKRLVTLLITFDGPVATATTLIVTVEVWDAATGQRVRSFLLNPPGAPTNPILVALNEPYLAVLRKAPTENTPAGGGQRPQQDMIEIWDVSAGQMLTVIAGFSYLQSNAMFWGPDRRTLATIVYDPSSLSGHAEIWDAPTGRRLSSFTLPVLTRGFPPSPAAWLPDGRFLSLGLDVYSIDTGERQMSYHADGNRVEAVAWSPDGKHLAVATVVREPGLYAPSTNTIFILDAVDGTQRFKHRAGGRASGMDLAFSPDSRYLLVTTNGSVEVWKAA